MSLSFVPYVLLGLCAKILDLCVISVIYTWPLCHSALYCTCYLNFVPFEILEFRVISVHMLYTGLYVIHLCAM